MTRKPTYEELERRLGELEKQVVELNGTENQPDSRSNVFQTLYDLATAMTADRGLDENLGLVVNKSRELIGTDASYIALRDETRDDIYMHSLSGVRTEAFKKLRLPIGKGLGGLVAKTRCGYIIDDYFASTSLTGKTNQIVVNEGLISGMAAPIQMGDENLGVLYASNRAVTAFSQTDLDTLFLIANLAAVEISRNRAQAVLKKAHDDLEQSVAERTIELSNSNARLKQEILERKRTAEALRESERHLRALLEFAPYPIVVFTLDGLVDYLNPAFTQIFGWSLSELAGKHIPYVPAALEEETTKGIKRLFDEKTILRYETKRLTKDGRVLDVIMRGAIYSDVKNEPDGQLVIIRDITREKKIARQNEAMLRISVALPEYPDMEMLFDYITNEVKQLLDTEGSFVALIDDERKEIFTLGAAYDDKDAQKRIKGMRFSTESLNAFVAEKILSTGEPVVVNDTSLLQKPYYPMRDKLLGYNIHSFLQMPLKSSDRIIGVLTAINKREGAFEQIDIELLSMIAGTVVLSVENARFSEELKNAYKEVSSLNRAKDKIISHLSHELKTPVSVLLGSLNILTKRLQTFPEDTWKPTMKRAARNLERIVDIQDQVNDIMHNQDYKAKTLLFLMLDQCKDELVTLFAETVGEGPMIESIKQSIEKTYGLESLVPESICLDEYVGDRVEKLGPLFSHRQLEIQSRLEPTPAIYLPKDHMRKVVDGLIKNAMENTPDEGKIELFVRKTGLGVDLLVHDYGIGISEEHQRRIFDGFFTSQETMAYSSKRPFDFNAGGKGADLLRMKIFSERYNFKIDMTSSKCRYIPRDNDVCPGRISKCAFCSDKIDCHQSGGTTFSLHFPPAVS